MISMVVQLLNQYVYMLIIFTLRSVKLPFFQLNILFTSCDETHNYFIMLLRFFFLGFYFAFLSLSILLNPSCTNGKILVRINLLFYLFFHRRPIQYLYVSFLQAFRFKYNIFNQSCGVENVLTMKDPQERNIQILDGTTVEKQVK